VTALTKDGEGYRVETSRGVYRARQVVIAMSNFQARRLPAWANELGPEIVRLHSSDYRSPEQLRPGTVLMVGAGNSGAEIGIELARRGHPVLLSGRDTGFVPFRIAGFWSRILLCRLLLRGVFHYLLTIRTPMGRKARPEIIKKGGPIIRQRPHELAEARIERVARTAGVERGMPRLEDGRVLDVANVVFSLGFGKGLDFVKLPIFGEDGEPRQQAGVAVDAPGLYFVGRHFQYSYSSTMIHGVGRDAARIATLAAERRAAQDAAPETVPRALRAA
jgi:putative flavoprotein involved in K+ transport